MAQTGQQRTLAGHLRVQSTGQVIPFTLVLAGDTIRYDFKDGAILLRLGENGSQLMEAARGDMAKVSPARYDRPVEGTPGGRSTPVSVDRWAGRRCPVMHTGPMRAER